MSQTMQNIRNSGGESLSAQLNAIPFPELLEESRGAVLNALPKHMDVDRIMRIALTAFRRSDSLQKCEPLSILAAVVQASQLGLEIGQNGEAFLVPFKKECQLVPGYKGLMKLVLQGRHAIDIYAQEVRQNDRFIQTYGLRREFIHEPLCHNGFLASDEERGLVTGFYAVAVLKSGERTYVTMSERQVNKIRDESSGFKAALQFGRSSPWIDDYVPMGLKTALRSLCNKLPMSSDLSTALALDTAANLGVSQSLTLKQAADGSYEPPNFGEAYEQQAAARSAPQSPEQPRQQGPRPSAAPRSTPRPAASPQASAAGSGAAARATTAPAPQAQSSAAPAKSASKQPAHGKSLQDLLAEMRNATSEQEISDLYLKAKPLCSGREEDDLNYQYDMAIKRTEEKQKEFFPS